MAVSFICLAVIADRFFKAEQIAGFNVVAREVEDVNPGELRLLTIFLTKDPSRVALLGARAEGRAHLVFGCSANTPEIDMAALLRKVVASVNGNGGGSPHMAQGGGPLISGLAEALETAKQELITMVG